MIRKAEMEDLDAILAIVEEVVPLMRKSGNEQWDDAYPSDNDFRNDILSGELFVDAEKNGVILSVVCLNSYEPEEYAAVEWDYDKPALVIHRLAVNPRFRGRGLAKKLFFFAEERAGELNLDYIRTDTCSLNPVMNALINKLGYKPAGVIKFPGKTQNYNCYEKSLMMGKDI